VVERQPSRRELIAMASPPCHVCEQPIQRVENRWRLVGATWKLAATMVCADGHRVPVEPFEEAK
jgi:hypothetical protein